jgi:hypothetical protein
MPEERCQKVWPTVQAVEFFDQYLAQLPGVLGGEVCQPAMFGVLPHVFVGIGLWSVRWQALGEDLRMRGQILLHNPRTVVDVGPVPENRHRPGDVLVKLLQECNRVLAMGVGVVGQQPEVEPQVPALGADRHGADGRDAIVPVPGLQDRGLATRGEGSADCGSQHESALVKEDQVGLASAGPADDFGQFLTPSVVDGNRVSLFGLLLRLLATPVEPKLDDLADMLGVVADAEVAADHLGDPCGGPQLGPPAVGFSTFQEQLLELIELVGIQARRSAGVRLGGKLGRGFALPFQPGVDGGSAAAEEAGDIVGMFALIDELNGAATPAFEFFCSSDRSHTCTTELHSLLFSSFCWSQ